MKEKDIIKAATKCVQLERSGVKTIRRLMFLLSVARRGTSTTTELVKDTKYSVTSVVITARDMHNKGLLLVTSGQQNSQQNEYTLSAKGCRLLEDFTA